MASNKKKMHDIISNLPEHIVDQILSCIPLRDAVRTSILSRNWRFKWVTVPCLVFDDKSILVSTLHESLREVKIVSIVDRVLSLHSGHIHKFELRLSDLTAASKVTKVDSWILYLSRSSVRELILKLWVSTCYNVPSSMYLCQKLTYLELYKCVLKFPREFKGFKSLKCLHLKYFAMEQLELELMISSCPLLEKLTLKPPLDSYTLLNIKAPNLAFLDIDGVMDINFMDTFNLVDVSISFYSYAWELSKIGSDNIINFFNGLPHIQRLRTTGYFFKYWANGTIPEKLPTPCLDLTFLTININFKNTKEYRALLCLLRSSPNLEELELHDRPMYRSTTTTADTVVENFESFPLNHLQLIKVFGISGSRQDLNFIEFLLANTPLLQRMIVKPDPVGGEGNFLLEELLCSRRASTSAEIIYLDP